MKFEEYPISKEILKSLRELEYARPTDIQFKAIPSILKGEDVMAVAQTGTGKTAAFAIPVIEILDKNKSGKRIGGIRCLVLAPTHELAQQIADVFTDIGKYTPIRTMCITGGVAQDPQIAQLEEGADILVATPGRMFDLVSQGHLRLHRVEILVLDEADHMLDLGFRKDIHDLHELLPKKRQTLFFSATLNPKIKRTAYSVVSNAIRIQISPKDPVAKNITHSVAFIEMDEKRFFLERIVRENPDSKIIAFVRTIVRAERVAKAMARVGIECLSIHREKAENERPKIVERFKQGKVKLLIATDITARGIDFPSVDYVINYDMPEVTENYVHRVGRTGRGKEKGVALSFCSSEEEPILREIESFLNKPITVLNIDRATKEETLLLTQNDESDWRSLMEDAEAFMDGKGKKGKKVKGRKGRK